MNWRGTVIAGLCCAAFGAQAPNTASSTFHAGTRLVQIEVVVRGRHGVVKGLTQDAFTVLDQGRPRHIDVFRAGQLEVGAQSAPLAPGVVSNRVNSRGESLPSATVVLFDQLNTRFDFKGYERKAMLNLIRGLGRGDSVAIYALGKNLHALLDFTDDPKKLLAAVTKLDSGRNLSPANKEDALIGFPLDSNGEIDNEGVGDALDRKMTHDAIDSLAGVSAQVHAARNASVTTDALRRIVQHLAGMPGRRNLIWIKEDPIVPPPVIGMLPTSLCIRS